RCRVHVPGGAPAAMREYLPLPPELPQELQKQCKDIYVSAPVRKYLAEIATATRNHPAVRYGVSPRGTLFLQKASQARASLQGRTFVLPEDVKELAPYTLIHRIILKPEEQLHGGNTASVLEEVLQTVRVPVPG
ncbi:MAG: MoxR family ATPase, partial [Spirochaetales bacterium]